MKKYFIQFDFWDQYESFNNYSYGIVEVDLTVSDLTEVCRDIIHVNFPELNPREEFHIKVNAFNNIAE